MEPSVPFTDGIPNSAATMRLDGGMEWNEMSKESSVVVLVLVTLGAYVYVPMVQTLEVSAHASYP
jgi:hypothetical protein